MTELIKIEYGKGVRLTESNLEISEPLPIEDAQELANGLEKMEHYTPWWWGRLFNYAEKMYGHEWTQIIPENERRSTYMKYKRICNVFKPDDVYKTLTFTHHELVEYCSPEDRKRLLDLCVKHSISSSALRKLLKGEKGDGEEKTLRTVVAHCPFCDGEFDVEV
jgi:hypothetical protein